MTSSPPLLSVVIPTHNRPTFLPRAIASALQAVSNGNIEVIVVPNGPDTSWKTISEKYEHEPRVKWHPITTANANAARNHGMDLALGKYIRFLDDDDTLIREGSQAQIALLEKTKAEICSSPIYLTNNDNEIIKTLFQPDKTDFISSLMSRKRVHQVTAHVFLKESIRATRWNEKLDFAQDHEWMLRLVHHKNYLWVKSDGICGHWTHHSNPRTSTSIEGHKAKKILAEEIISLLKALKDRNALTTAYECAASETLWDCVHQCLFASPTYWIGIAQLAKKLDPFSKPDLCMHKLNLHRIGISPLMLEILIVPKRFIQYKIKKITLRLGLVRQKHFGS